MKMPLTCAECMRIDISTAGFITTTDLRDDGCYEVLCPKGHKAFVILQEQKFELLFDIGACALVDGYYRESVLSFTSSVERFYEFVVRAAAIQRKISPGELENSWKPVARQSERQLGAFIFVYLLEFSETPLLLTTKETEFRNDVIHRGKIPTRDEALEYGESALKVIRAGIQKAKTRFSEGFEKLVFDHLKTAHEKATKGFSMATSSMPTIVGLNIAEASHHTRSLEKALEGLKMWNIKM